MRFTIASRSSKPDESLLDIQVSSIKGGRRNFWHFRGSAEHVMYTLNPDIAVCWHYDNKSEIKWGYKGEEQPYSKRQINRSTLLPGHSCLNLCCLGRLPGLKLNVHETSFIVRKIAFSCNLGSMAPCYLPFCMVGLHSDFPYFSNLQIGISLQSIQRVPKPLLHNASQAKFSEGRALQHVEALTGKGVRLVICCPPRCWHKPKASSTMCWISMEGRTL